MTLHVLASTVVVGLLLSSAPWEQPPAQCGNGAPGLHGPTPFSDTNGNQFEYRSESRSAGQGFAVRHFVRNTGRSTISFYWEKADFSRSGVPRGIEAQSQCHLDRNPPNTEAGDIRYGPLLQSIGPRNARFFALIGASSQQTPATSVIEWDAHQAEGSIIKIRVALVATLLSPTRVALGFQNTGDPVHVIWDVVQRSNWDRIQGERPDLTFAQSRLVLPANGKAAIELSGEPAFSRRAAVVSVFSVDGRPLYRDRHPAFTNLPSPAR